MELAWANHPKKLFSANSTNQAHFKSWIKKGLASVSAFVRKSLKAWVVKSVFPPKKGLAQYSSSKLRLKIGKISTIQYYSHQNHSKLGSSIQQTLFRINRTVRPAILLCQAPSNNSRTALLTWKSKFKIRKGANRSESRSLETSCLSKKHLEIIPKDLSKSLLFRIKLINSIQWIANPL